jgi:hypothetical protein
LFAVATLLAASISALVGAPGSRRGTFHASAFRSTWLDFSLLLPYLVGLSFQLGTLLPRRNELAGLVSPKLEWKLR